MPNAHGDFIWYELATTQPDTAKLFYDDVCQWKIGPKPDQGMDYRMIESAGGQIGGVMPLAPEMIAGGARAGWLGYIAVDDVDATVGRAAQAGGAVVMPPWDIPDIGRLAMLADPLGSPFYVMRGASDESSAAFAPAEPGHVSWNELSSPDMARALDFYLPLFGWTRGEALKLGDLGDYQFLEHGGEMIGAASNALPNAPATGWTFAFAVPDILAARERVTAGQGRPMEEPVEVPGGRFAMECQDPEGVRFYLSGPKV